MPPYEPQYFLLNQYSQALDDDGLLDVQAQLDKNTLLRLANIGNLYNEYVFPNELKPLVISSDGRPLPTAFETDTLRVFPGERYQVLLRPQGTTPWLDSIRVNYRWLANNVQRHVRYIKVGVDDYSNVPSTTQTGFAVYPNPAHGPITVLCPMDGQKTFALFNAQGQQVLREASNSSQHVVQTEFLPPGVYTLEVQSVQSHQKFLKKLVIY